ncbi:hypothetical protein ABZ914_03335 [Spirillospora sp. NPDC046719]
MRSALLEYGHTYAQDMKACIELEHTTWKINEGSSGYGPSNADVGVAPFYYPWTVTLGLKNSSGTVVKTWDTSWDLRTVMPLKIRAFPDWGVGSDPTYRDFGYPQYFQPDVGLTGVANGDYQLVMRVKNPLEAVSANAKKLRFANAAQNADGWLGLGAMTVGAGSPSAAVEAEDPGNTLVGGAAVASCTGCSGGSKVGYIGNGTATTVAFPATGGWDTVATTTVPVTLTGGDNTITIAGPDGWAPDIDKITITSG